MKRVLTVLACSTLLTACASTGSSSSSSQLPAGHYVLKGHNTEGKQLGGTLKIDVPFSDPSFAVGVLCSNQGTTVVKATNDAGVVTTFRCVIHGQPAS